LRGNDFLSGCCKSGKERSEKEYLFYHKNLNANLDGLKQYVNTTLVVFFENKDGGRCPPS